MAMGHVSMDGIQAGAKSKEPDSQESQMSELLWGLGLCIPQIFMSAVGSTFYSQWFLFPDLIVKYLPLVTPTSLHMCPSSLLSIPFPQ